VPAQNLEQDSATTPGRVRGERAKASRLKPLRLGHGRGEWAAITGGCPGGGRFLPGESVVPGFLWRWFGVAAALLDCYSYLLYPWGVHVISRKALSTFVVAHPDSAEPLANWYRIVSKTEFRNMAELRQAFNSVDAVSGLYVFNIGGNKFRLVAAVHFNVGRVYIRRVMTHAEYDKGAWKP